MFTKIFKVRTMVRILDKVRNRALGYCVQLLNTSDLSAIVVGPMECRTKKPLLFLTTKQ